MSAPAINGSDEQTFGAEEQVPHGAQSYQYATGSATQFLCPPPIWRDPLRGQRLPVFHRPLAARAERKLNMGCLYSTACVYGVTALTVAIWLFPLLIILWLWRKTHIRRTWVPFLLFLGLIFLIQGVSALIGPNELMALAYILAGAAK
jgi:4-amino-4-deoxy-L-arabinose transferase-like glycosyltransferase